MIICLFQFFCVYLQKQYEEYVSQFSILNKINFKVYGKDNDF